MFLRCILLFLFCAGSAAAQSDTLFKKNTEVVACKITNVVSKRIYYIDKNQTGRSLELSELVWYSQSGKRTQLRNNFRDQTVTVDSVNITDELAHLRMCMNKFYAQYSTGVGITLIGGALAGSSVFIKGDESLGRGMGIGGIVMMIVGTVVTVDAHRWFAKAGWGVNGKGNMVEVRYRFK